MSPATCRRMASRTVRAVGSDLANWRACVSASALFTLAFPISRGPSASALAWLLSVERSARLLAVRGSAVWSRRSGSTLRTRELRLPSSAMENYLSAE